MGFLTAAAIIGAGAAVKTAVDQRKTAKEAAAQQAQALEQASQAQAKQSRDIADAAAAQARQAQLRAQTTAKVEALSGIEPEKVRVDIGEADSAQPVSRERRRAYQGSASASAAPSGPIRI